MMKKFLCILLATVLLSLTLVSCKEEPAATPNTPDRVAPKADQIDLSTLENLDNVTVCEEQTDYVLIDVEKYGKILIRLFPDVAPQSVANFKDLVSKGFYSGVIFHRVEKGMVVQAGIPTSGWTETPKNIFGEFADNGFENNLNHVRGVVGVARSNDNNSGSSQFYICHKNSTVADFDNRYATFGFVVHGMDIVDKMTKVNVNSDKKPLTDIVISSAQFAKIG